MDALTLRRGQPRTDKQRHAVYVAFLSRQATNITSPVAAHGVITAPGQTQLLCIAQSLCGRRAAIHEDYCSYGQTPVGVRCLTACPTGWIVNTKIAIKMPGVSCDLGLFLSSRIKQQ